MRFKVAGIAILVGIIAIIIILVVGKYAGVATFRSATRIAYVGTETRSAWTGRYKRLNGTMEKRLYPRGDALDIRVTTEAGTIAIQLRDENGVIFDERDMGTADFTVEVSGWVEATIQAENHTGSFSIK